MKVPTRTLSLSMVGGLASEVGAYILWSALGTLFASWFAYFLFFALAFLWIVIYSLFKPQSEKPPDEKFAVAYAERKQDLEERRKKFDNHQDNILRLYDEWASSYITHKHPQITGGGDLSYSDTHLKILRAGWPQPTLAYFKEAETDLTCCPQTEEALRKANGKFTTASNISMALVSDLTEAIRSAMQRHNFKPNPTSEVRATYREEAVIEYLILRRIADGDRFETPRNFRYQFNGVSSVLPNGQRDVEFAYYVESEQRANEMVNVLQNLPEEINIAKNDQQHFPKLMARIVSFQRSFTEAEQAHTDFTGKLTEFSKKLRDGRIDLSECGKCETCEALRKN